MRRPARGNATRASFGRRNVETGRLIHLARSPELDLRVIEDAGHWVPYEAADRVNAMLLGWLERDAS